MQKRSGTLKERFLRVKEHYPKDFLNYVIYESRMKRHNRKTKIDYGDVIVDGSEEVYAKIRDCYNKIYDAFRSLANKSYILYLPKITKCSYGEYLTHEKLVISTRYAFGIGFESMDNAQALSDNFSRPITSGNVRMAIEGEYIKRITVVELREDADVCAGMLSNVLAWNPNFESYFILLMSCEENHGDIGGISGGGGTTNPPTKPEPEKPCSDAKCPVCKKCLNPTKPNCSKCECVKECDHILCGGCHKPISYNESTLTRSTSSSCATSHPWCTCPWWTSDHNTITKLGLKGKLTENQLQKVHEGQVAVDLLQELEHSPKHAMRTRNQTVEEAMIVMKVHFTENVLLFANENKFENLGQAIHSIQDAYSSAHDFNIWTRNNLLPHLFESMLSYTPQANQAAQATGRIYDEIMASEKPLTEARAEAIYNAWLLRFKNNEEN